MKAKTLNQSIWRLAAKIFLLTFAITLLTHMALFHITVENMYNGAVKSAIVGFSVTSIVIGISLIFGIKTVRRSRESGFHIGNVRCSSCEQGWVIPLPFSVLHDPDSHLINNAGWWIGVNGSMCCLNCRPTTLSDEAVVEMFNSAEKVFYLHRRAIVSVIPGSCKKVMNKINEAFWEMTMISGTTAKIYDLQTLEISEVFQKADKKDRQ